LRWCLDTSAYIHFKAGERAAVERLDSAIWVGVPAIVLGELDAAFRLGKRQEENLAELERFLAHPLVEPISVDHDVARAYGEIVVALRRTGRPIPTNDVWIAACAARAGATLVTYDVHFEAVERIGVVLLEPE